MAAMPSLANRRAPRRAKRARKPVRPVEVSRIEFENVYTEIVGLMKGIRRLETEVQRLTDRIHRLERRVP